MKTSKSRKLFLTAFALAALACAQQAAAQIIFVGGSVSNANYEQGVFGAIADTTCTVSAIGSPAWTSPSMPASLNAGDSVTWGYTDGTAGSSGLGGTAGTNQYKLRNVAFRNVIRGANNNGGTASSLNCYTTVGNGKTHVDVTIWGPTLNSFGVSGATNFSWEIRDLNNNLLSSGTGEAVVRVNFSGTLTLSTKVTPTDANENGSVFVSYTI